MKVLIVGSTGTIGKAVSKLFTENGFVVIETSRKSQPAVDMTDMSSIEAFYRDLGQVDAIVTIAGEAAFMALDKLDEKGIQLSLK